MCDINHAHVTWPIHVEEKLCVYEIACVIQLIHTWHVLKIDWNILSWAYINAIAKQTMLHSDKHSSSTLVHALCKLIYTRYSPSYIRKHTHRPTSRDTNKRYSPPHPHVLHERDAPCVTSAPYDLGSDHLQVSAGERQPHVCVRILYECLCVCLCAWVCVRVCEYLRQFNVAVHANWCLRQCAVGVRASAKLVAWLKKGYAYIEWVSHAQLAP